MKDFELIAQYLLDNEQSKGLGCNEYTHLIQMINRQLDLFGRDLEINELSFFTTILMSSMAESNFIDNKFIVNLIIKILKVYENHVADDDLTITKFLEYLKEVK